MIYKPGLCPESRNSPITHARRKIFYRKTRGVLHRASCDARVVEWKPLISRTCSLSALFPNLSPRFLEHHLPRWSHADPKGNTRRSERARQADNMPVSKKQAQICFRQKTGREKNTRLRPRSPRRKTGQREKPLNHRTPRSAVLATHITRPGPAASTTCPGGSAW